MNDLLSVKELSKLSTRTLRGMIKNKTAEVNIEIGMYRDAVKEGKQAESKATENMINRMKRAAGTNAGRRGEVGLGLTYKRKDELIAQYNQLQKFLKYDLSIPAHAAEREASIEKSRATWNRRYGYMSKEEFSNLSYDMTAVAAALNSYGYEDIGGEIAENYQNANKKGRQNFLKYVLTARDAAKGGTPEDIIDQLIRVMTDDGAFE